MYIWMCASTLSVRQKCRHGTPITSSFMQASTIQPSQGMIIRNSDGNLMKSKGSAMTGNWVTKICLWEFFMVLLSFCFWKIKGINNLKSKEAHTLYTERHRGGYCTCAAGGFLLQNGGDNSNRQFLKDFNHLECRSHRNVSIGPPMDF